jgi:hypothetical protein
VPFTGSHPLAVLPLVAAKRWLPLDPTCLVVGAMAPDLEYFARGYISGGKLGHEWIGLVVWCLPATLAVAWLWHAILKWPLALVAPRRLAARLVPHLARRWPSRGVAILAASAIVGALTHLAWDACTHGDGFVVTRVPALAGPFPLTAIPVHRVLQVGCSVVGLAGLAIALARTTLRTPPVALPDVPRTRARLTMIAAIAIGAPLFTLRLFLIGHTSSGDFMVAPTTGALAGILVVAIAVRSGARALARPMLDLAA